MEDLDLAVAVRACADPDRRDLQSVRDASRQFCGDELEGPTWMSQANAQGFCAFRAGVAPSRASTNEHEVRRFMETSDKRRGEE